MSRKITVSLLLVFLMSLAVSATYAQDTPRPTPTEIGSTVPPETTPEPSGSTHGTVRGFVYIDTNGDGKCVNTGVAGECHTDRRACGVALKWLLRVKD